MELYFLEKRNVWYRKYEPIIANLHILLKASAPKRHPLFKRR